MTSHDIGSFAAGLSARLAARTRHVSVFLGAGSSKSAGLPDVAELERMILTTLDDPLHAQFDRLLVGRNLEGVLSRLRRIVALLGADDAVDGLSANEARELDTAVCQIIVSTLARTESLNRRPSEMLASWLSRASYARPVELFTVNYDLLVEQALDAVGALYFDGFGGLLTGRFRADLVDSDGRDVESVPAWIPRVWKLHGSLNWVLSKVRSPDGGLPRRTASLQPSTRRTRIRRLPQSSLRRAAGSLSSRTP